MLRSATGRRAGLAHTLLHHEDECDEYFIYFYSFLQENRRRVTRLVRV